MSDYTQCGVQSNCTPNQVPPGLWTVTSTVGVVFAAFIALRGVKHTNRENNKRQQEQLSHEREMQKIERELSLRKEVYLAAIEAMSAGIIAIKRFSDVCIPSDKLTEIYFEKTPLIDKVKL